MIRRLQPALGAAAPNVSSVLPLGHVVQCYESDDYLCDSVASFVAEGLVLGQPVIVVVTPEHWRQVMESLSSARSIIQPAIDNGQLQFRDARETLAEFMDGEKIDRTRLNPKIDAPLER